jgi:hypothetical protein
MRKELLVICSFILQLDRPNQESPKDAHIAQTGGNILPFFSADVEGWLEYGKLKMPKRFAPKNQHL